MALIGPNGAGKSTLMRMLSGVEAPDRASRTLGHQVVMQYFAQDEATRLDPTQTVYETLADGSPAAHGAGDPQHPRRLPLRRRRRLQEGRRCCRAASARGWRSRGCSCGRRTRCSSTSRRTTSISDSKDVLLDALEDFGGTLILVSHDRYFIDRLATKVIEIGNGEGLVVPGRVRRIPLEQGATRCSCGMGASRRGQMASAAQAPPPRARRRGDATGAPRAGRCPDDHDAAGGDGRHAERSGSAAPAPVTREDRKRLEAEQRRHRRALDALRGRVSQVEAAIAEREAEMRKLETTMSAPGFYEDRDARSRSSIATRRSCTKWVT